MFCFWNTHRNSWFIYTGRKLFGRNKIHWSLPERWQALAKVNHIGSTWQRINTQLLLLKKKGHSLSGWRDWGDGIKETVSVMQHDSSCGETRRVSPEQLHISFSSNSRGIRNSGFAVTDKMATMRPKPKQSMWASSPTECSGINCDTMWLNITSIFGIWKYLPFVKNDIDLLRLCEGLCAFERALKQAVQGHRDSRKLLASLNKQWLHCTPSKSQFDSSFCGLCEHSKFVVNHSSFDLDRKQRRKALSKSLLYLAYFMALTLAILTKWPRISARILSVWAVKISLTSQKLTWGV